MLQPISPAANPILNLQGAKAQQKRERNQAKSGSGAKSQVKTNEAAKNIVCQTCRQTFVSRDPFRSPELVANNLVRAQLLTTRAPA